MLYDAMRCDAILTPSNSSFSSRWRGITVTNSISHRKVISEATSPRGNGNAMLVDYPSVDASHQLAHGREREEGFPDVSISLFLIFLSPKGLCRDNHPLHNNTTSISTSTTSVWVHLGAVIAFQTTSGVD